MCGHESSPSSRMLGNMLDPHLVEATLTLPEHGITTSDRNAGEPIGLPVDDCLCMPRVDSFGIMKTAVRAVEPKEMLLVSCDAVDVRACADKRGARKHLRTERKTLGGAGSAPQFGQMVGSGGIHRVSSMSITSGL